MIKKDLQDLFRNWRSFCFCLYYQLRQPEEQPEEQPTEHPFEHPIEHPVEHPVERPEPHSMLLFFSTFAARASRDGMLEISPCALKDCSAAGDENWLSALVDANGEENNPTTKTTPATMKNPINTFFMLYALSYMGCGLCINNIQYIVIYFFSRADCPIFRKNAGWLNNKYPRL